jgi:hypothetical protein
MEDKGDKRYWQEGNWLVCLFTQTGYFVTSVFEKYNNKRERYGFEMVERMIGAFRTACSAVPIKIK